MGSGNTVLDSVARTTFPEGWQWSNSRDAPLTHLVWGQTPRKEAFLCPDTLILKDAQVALTLDTGRTHPWKATEQSPRVLLLCSLLEEISEEAAKISQPREKLPCGFTRHFPGFTKSKGLTTAFEVPCPGHVSTSISFLSVSNDDFYNLASYIVARKLQSCLKNSFQWEGLGSSFINQQNGLEIMSFRGGHGASGHPITTHPHAEVSVSL